RPKAAQSLQVNLFRFNYLTWLGTCSATLGDTYAHSPARLAGRAGTRPGPARRDHSAPAQPERPDQALHGDRSGQSDRGPDRPPGALRRDGYLHLLPAHGIGRLARFRADAGGSAWFNNIAHAGTSAINMNGSGQYAYGNAILGNRYEFLGGGQVTTGVGNL